MLAKETSYKDRGPDTVRAFAQFIETSEQAMAQRKFEELARTIAL